MAELWDVVHADTRRLCPPGTRVLVATSGGPDSQALLDLLAGHARDLGLQVFAAGVDHGLRPEADAELALAAALAHRHGVPFARLAVTVERSGNLLARARAARYDALRAHAAELGAQRIAVAHTASDQAETVLFHLARGAGLLGASGMRARHGPIVRPLLAATRADVLRHLAARELPYARDPSNEDPRRMRAQLRATVVPALERVNSGAVRNLARFARRARDDERFLSSLATGELERARRPGGAFDPSAVSPALRPRALRLWLAEHGVTADARDLERLARLRREGASSSAGGVSVMWSRGRYWAGPSSSLGLRIDGPGRWELPQGLTLTMRMLAAAEEDWSVACSATRVAFDADRLHLPLWVRAVLPGDKLRPFGAPGSTKVGDLFTNLKIPRPLRSAWPLLAAGDEVAWVVGLRRGSLAPIAKDTRRVVVFEVDGLLPWTPLRG